MSGSYVTDKRDLSRTVRSVSDYVFFGTPVHQVNDFVLQADQTTYGFRSTRDLDPYRNFGGTRIDVPKDVNPSAPQPYDTGHEFWTRKRTEYLSHESSFIGDYDGYTSVRGALMMSLALGPNAFPSVPLLSQNDINFYGSKAIRATAPTTPGANVTDFLAQSIQMKNLGLGDLNETVLNLQHRASFFREIGNSYLNLQFGWVPFMNDLTKVIKQLSSISEKMLQYSRDSGRLVRRRYKFPQTFTTEFDDQSFGSQVLIGAESAIFGGGHTKFGVPARTYTLVQDIWFSGGYTYYLNMGSDFASQLELYHSLAQKTLGLDFTPKVLWDLAPWTWLLDWKANIGDIVSNNDAFASDNLVLKYGYLMRQSVAEYTYTMDLPGIKRGSKGPFDRSFKVVQKERVKATPFGFGIDPSTFSPYQISILVALGLNGPTGAFRR